MTECNIRNRLKTGATEGWRKMDLLLPLLFPMKQGSNKDAPIKTIQQISHHSSLCVLTAQAAACKTLLLAKHAKCPVPSEGLCVNCFGNGYFLLRQSTKSNACLDPLFRRSNSISCHLIWSISRHQRGCSWCRLVIVMCDWDGINRRIPRSSQLAHAVEHCFADSRWWW